MADEIPGIDAEVIRETAEALVRGIKDIPDYDFVGEDWLSELEWLDTHLASPSGLKFAKATQRSLQELRAFVTIIADKAEQLNGTIDQLLSLLEPLEKEADSENEKPE